MAGQALPSRAFAAEPAATAPIGVWQPASAPAPGPDRSGADAALLEHAPVPGPATAPAKMPVATPQQQQFDVTRYGLDLTVDPDREQLEGTVRISARVVEGPLATMVLDLLDPMVCNRAWRASRNLPAKVTQAGGLLYIDLGRAFAAGETLSVHVEFSGRPEPYGLYGFQFFTTSDGTAAAASLSEPWSARSWWPCKDDVADKAPFSVTLHVPAGMTGVSNGNLVSGEMTALPLDGDGAPAAAGEPATPAAPSARAAALRPLSTFIWEEPLPLSTYQFSVAVADYVRLDDLYVGKAGTLQLHHWVYPGLVEAARSDFAVLPQMMAFCEDHFGPYPYPDQKYGMALFEWDGAMEHPTATTYGSLFVTGDGYFETVIMHELSHQWFGDQMTCADWTHIWLHEGFATYVEGLWKEFRGGPTALKWFMKARADFTWWKDPLVRAPDRTDPWYYFHNMVYYKGAWVLHMLRHQIGDPAFFACLDHFATWPAFRYGLVDSQDFADLVRQVSGEDLGWFFQQWLYWRVNPILRVTWRNLESGLVEVRIEQVQAADPVYGNQPFILPIDLRLQGTGIDQTVTTLSVLRDQTLTLAPGGPISSLTVDPNGWLLFKLEAAKSPPPADRPEVKLEAATPNPFNPRCRLAWCADDPTSDTVEIYDLRGRLVARRQWPERPAGPRAWTWEGRDRQGRDCATGTYVFRISCRGAGGLGAAVLRGKITLAR